MWVDSNGTLLLWAKILNIDMEKCAAGMPPPYGTCTSPSTELCANGTKPPYGGASALHFSSVKKLRQTCWETFGVAPE